MLPMTRISTPARRPILQHAQNQVVADLRVVDEQLLLRLADERGQQLARVLRADHEAVVARRVGLAVAVRLEQRAASLTSRLSRGDHAEAAALLDVQLGVVEAEDVQHVVDDHHLAVIARQIVGGARHGDAGVEQPQLELAQALLAAAVGVRDQRPDHDAARHGRLERLLELDAIEAEDDDVDRLPGLTHRFQQRGEAVVGLDDQLHGVASTDSLLLRLLLFPLDREVAVGIELEDPVGDVVGLDFDRHLDLVADLLVGGAAQLERQLVRLQDAFDLVAPGVGVGPP